MLLPAVLRCASAGTQASEYNGHALQRTRPPLAPPFVGWLALCVQPDERLAEHCAGLRTEVVEAVRQIHEELILLAGYR